MFKRMKTLPQTQSGYSLVEVLVAISVLLIALVGPLTIAYQGLKSANLAKNVNTAFFLAQEGIELVQLGRENAGLERYSNTGSTHWTGDDSIPGGLCAVGDPCGIDSDTVTLEACSTLGCELYWHDTGVGRFRHESSGGEDTNFVREITLTPAGDYLLVESMVTWGNTSDEQVTLQTYLFNIYDL